MTNIKKPFSFSFLMICIFSFTACTSLQFKFDTTKEIQNAVRPHQSTLPAYELTGGQWVKGQALFINHDFDFGMAMGIPDIGPAIAAGQRRKRNEETAALFEGLPSLSFQTQFEDAIKKSDRNKAIRGNLRLYGILFGYPKAHLKVILEKKRTTETTDNTAKRFIYVTDWKLVEGKNSWGAENGKQILASFDQAIPLLIEMWLKNHVQKPGSSVMDYQYLGGKSPQKGSGWVLRKNTDRVLIVSKSIPNTVITFPRARFKIIGSNQIP